LLSFFFTHMNELEELALDSVATGGPKEVLTEQANNNPDIPKVDPVEPGPSPEKKSQDPVDAQPVDVDLTEVRENNIPSTEESTLSDGPEPFENLSGGDVRVDTSDLFELENPEIDFTDPLEHEFIEGDFGFDNQNLAGILGFKSPKELIKYMKENSESLPVIGDWLKAQRVFNEKRQKLQDSITKITEDQNLTRAEQQAKIKTELESQGLTYGDNSNYIYLTGRDDINEITKQVYDDPLVSGGLIGNTRIYGTKDGKVDPNNLKMPDDAGMNQAIAYIAEKYAPAFKNQSGGVDNLDFQLMEQISDLTLLSDKNALKNILRMKPGEIPAMPYILAMRDLYNIEARRLNTYIDEMVASGDSNEAILKAKEQFEIVANLQLKISGIKTNLGRALASLRRESGFGPEVDTKQVTKRRDDSFTYTRAEQDDTLMDEAEFAYQDVKDRLGVNEDPKDMANFFKKWQELPEKEKYGFQKTYYKYKTAGKVNEFYENLNTFWVNALLSSPMTHMRNIVGNSLMLAKHMTEKYAIGAVGSSANALGIKNDLSTLSDVHASTGALILSLKEAMFAGIKTGRTGEIPEQLGSKTKFDSAKYDMRSQVPDLGPDATMIQHMLHNSHRLINIPTGMLRGEDTFFKVLAQRYDITLQAQKSGRARGLAGDDLINYVAEFIADPPFNALQKSMELADYMTFQNELGPKMKKISEAVAGSPARWMIPFFKTPYNIARVTFKDGSPIGIAHATYRATLKGEGTEAFGSTQEEVAEFIAKQAFGNFAIFYSMYLASTGFTTEDGTKHPTMVPGYLKDDYSNKKKGEIRNINRRQGSPEYSYAMIQDDGTVKYLPLRGMEPFSSWLMLGTDLYNIFNNPDLYDETDNDVYQLFTASAYAMQNAVLNKTFAQGFDMIFKVAMEPERFIGKNLENIVLGFVPNIVNQGAKANDPMMRQAMTLREKLMRKLPFFRKMLNPMLDLHGNELEEYQQGFGSFWNPLTRANFKPENLTPIQKDWLLFQEGPTLPKPKFSFNGVVIDLRNFENGSDVFYEMQQVFAEFYNKIAVPKIQADPYYIINKRLWAESIKNGPGEVLYRDRSINQAQLHVNNSREMAIAYYISNPSKFKHADKVISKLQEGNTKNIMDKLKGYY